MTIKTQPTKRKPTLKIYRTDGVQSGWENRLGSIGSSTYLLHEEMDYSQNRILLKVGERLGESKHFPDEEIYHRESDWLITKLQHYPSLEDDFNFHSWSRSCKASTYWNFPAQEYLKKKKASFIHPIHSMVSGYPLQKY